MGRSRNRPLCHVRLSVSDISKSLPHGLVHRQADCDTGGHCSVLPWEELLWVNSCRISTYLLRCLIFPCTYVSYVNTHIKHNFMYAVLWSTGASIKMVIDIEWISYWLCKGSSCLHRGTVGERGGDAPFPGIWDTNEFLFLENVLIEESEMYVKEGSWHEQVSP